MDYQYPSQDPRLSLEERLKILYPMVNEEETPLPRAWSTKVMKGGGVGGVGGGGGRRFERWFGKIGKERGVKIEKDKRLWREINRRIW